MNNEKVVPKNSTKQIVMPIEISKKYIEYCHITRLRFSDSLRVMVMESIPRLHDSDELEQIINKTRQRNLYAENSEEYAEHYIRLPREVIEEVNMYCAFFKIKRKRCHFLYFLIEKKLLSAIEEILYE